HGLGVLGDHLPKSFCVKLVRQGLTDRSKLVRKVAANEARCHILSEVIPDLINLAGVEKDAQTKWEMEHAVALIRDGYHQYLDEDGWQFVVRTSDGYPAMLLYPGSGWCTQSDIEERGAKVVAEEIRRLHTNDNWRHFRWPEEGA